MRNEFEVFRNCLAALLAGAAVAVDSPDDPAGESFLDVSHGSFETVVSFRPDKGFGIYADNEGFGDRPDAVIRDPEAAAFCVAQMALQHAAGERLVGMTLRQTRQMLGYTQQQIAEIMQVSQPSVASFERSRSPGLATMARHARSMGAELQVLFVRKDMEVRLSHPSLQQTG